MGRGFCLRDSYGLVCFRRGPRGPFGNVGLTSETLVIGIGEGRGEGGPVSGESVTPESKTAPWMWGGA